MELERKDEYTVAVVGATGAVGREMLETLARLEFPVGALRALASARSAGKELPWAGGHVVVEDLEAADLSGIDIALFSAGGSTSKAWAPKFVEAGAIVVDNSSAWRMDESVPLVVPEVNPDALDGHAGIIANPNCSTIQMVVALKPIHDAAGIERVVVSTYQSASGAGQQGIDELMADVAAALGTGEEPERAKFAHPLAFEALPHIDVFMDGGYTREELKMLHETRKIMGLPELDVSATCVRVPVVRGHSEAVTLDLRDALTGEAARALLAASPGVTLVDDPARAEYPLARTSEGADAVFVGRVRQDLNRPRTLHMWVVSDNLLKGAALNAVQIAQALVSRATQGDR